MKNHLLWIIAIIVLLNVWTAGEVSAQSLKAAKVKIGFDFQIGDKKYPAGDYIVESVSRTNDNLLQISNTNGKNKKLIVANLSNAGKREEPKLVFQRHGENLFLTKIFLDGTDWGYALRPSRKQRESEKNLASAPTQIVEVSLSSNAK